MCSIYVCYGCTKTEGKKKYIYTYICKLKYILGKGRRQS